MTQIMCVRLKQWPIDRVKRRQRPERRHDPLTLLETIGARQVVVEACDRAMACGIQRGMTLAQARARCSTLTWAACEPKLDLRGLIALGRWLMRFSPVVSPAPPDAIFLNVTGCERLYGGLNILMDQVVDALRRLRIGICVVIAPTPGAAWAIASGESGHGKIISPDDLAATLAPLPPAFLRLDPDTSAVLEQLGIRTIAQLISLPRDTMPARFGANLLRRIDAAFGRITEPLLPLVHRSPVEANIEFDGEVGSTETIWHAFRHLLDRVIGQLIRCGCGARHLQIEFRRAYATPILRTVQLARPSRNPTVLFNLLRCTFEAVESDEGFTALFLTVPLLERMTDVQLSLLDQEERAADDELAHLIERLSARLGPQCVARSLPVASHLPERAYRLAEADLATAVPTRPANKAPLPDEAKATVIRPLRLLPVPVEIAAIVAPSHDGDGPPVSFREGRTVHRLICADGPERIAGVWWEGRRKTRDYFDAQNEAGRRFWLFRVIETGKWYLHGLFE